MRRPAMDKDRSTKLYLLHSKIGELAEIQRDQECAEERHRQYADAVLVHKRKAEKVEAAIEQLLTELYNG
jgi:hypothetical protein